MRSPLRHPPLASMLLVLVALILGALPATAADQHRIFLPLVHVSAPPIIASFRASPASIAPGGTSTLLWSVSGATSLSISPDIGPVSGTSIAVSPAVTSEYTLTASNAAGSVTAKTTLVVADGAGSAGQLFLPSASNSTRPAIAIDAAGGIHVAYSHASSGGGGYPAQYAYCPSACTKSANWTSVIVGNEGIWGGDVKLALDPQGHPRLVWLQQLMLGEDGTMMYATCDQGCTSAANWTVSPLMETFVVSSGEYFALDPQGRPRFIHSDPYDYVVSCDANCTSVANWSPLRLDTATFDPYVQTLTYDAGGRLRMAYTTSASGGKISFGYAECDADCGTLTNWRFLSKIFNVGVGYDITMRLDAQGRPRVAIYTGYTDSSNPQNNLLYYLWCDADCTSAASAWSGYQMPLPKDYGRGVALALDSQGRPRMAYNIDNIPTSVYGLGYAWCIERCEAAGAVWDQKLVERIESLGGLWLYLGKNTSMALDADGHPRIAYDAEQCCGGNGVQLVRFAQFNQP